MTPAENAVRGGRRGGRSRLRRAADAEPLGAPAAQHRVVVVAHGHAVPAGGRLRRGVAAGTQTGCRRDGFAGDEVVYVSTGDGATSEGEFWESLSTACNLKLPVVYLVEDNGYAISVPVEVNTPGVVDLASWSQSFPGLYIEQVDGCDLVASYGAMARAIAYARARKGPALVHAT